MDAVTLALAKNHTNEQVIQKATNSPVEEISFDGGIYSVGNNVVNGQVSDVVIKGQTRTNLVDGEITYLNFKTIAVIPNALFCISIENITNATEWRWRIRFYKNNVNITNTVNTSNIVGLLSLYVSGSYLLEGAAAKNKVFYFENIDADKIEITIGSGNTTEESITEKLMVEQGVTTRGSYISYGTKSTNSVRIKSAGKNLIKNGSGENGVSDWIKRVGSETFVNNGNGTFSVTSIVSSQGVYQIIDVKPNTNYYVNANIISGDGNVRIQDLTFSTIIKIGSGVFNTGTNDKIVIYMRSNSATTLVFSKVQLEEGSVATEYEPYKESIVNVNLPEPLRSLPNGTKDEVNVTTGVKTQRVSGEYTLDGSEVWVYKSNYSGETTAYFTTDLLDNLALVDPITPNNSIVVSGYPKGIVWGTDNACIELVKTVPKLRVRVLKSELEALSAAGLNTWLRANPITLTYQLAEPIITKLPAQPPLQVFENGTVYVEPIGDASESTLPSVEMTIPTGTSNKFGVATHDYDGAAADWELTNSESKCFLLAVSSAGGAANIIAPDAPGALYAISNASGQTVTIKISGGTGVAVNTGKKVLVIHDGTDYVALTAEL